MSQNLIEAVGWVSSAILFLTSAKQVYKQWQSGATEGISKWLFLGQMAASFGFGVYSWLLGNKVFVFTNALMVVNGLVGYLIVMRNKRRSQSG
ncbi:MAG: SemiSWEET family transporter [Bryobacteraceae bacterium]